ncbi:hypothetical protein KAM350_41250 [Aeromonas caviae]|uniref:antA/AntB antirepressor family protein n=1 Tax=Aeromonas caviae TaxID=648 RepID=UPI001CC473AE|nr:antA/AntB antirepressor family protein [Aeromonas caviae]GJA61132.1 hypothetical protein KAM350_41250 [Aeromonas caviae]
MTGYKNGLTAQGGALPKISQPPQPSLAKWLPLTSQYIEGKAVQTVNARELHSFLKVGRDFSNWIKDRIAEYGFVEGGGYLVFTKFGENPQGGRPQKEYAIRQHMSAYQLALVAYLERSNATLLDVGMPFDERKEQLAAMLAIKVEREGKQ